MAISAPRRPRRLVLLILKRPVVAVTKPVSHCLQLRIAEWRSRLGYLKPIGPRSSGVGHLPQEKFQRGFSALNGLELRLDTSSFLQAPTYCRNRRREWNFPLLHYAFRPAVSGGLVAAGLLRTAASQITRYPVSAPRPGPQLGACRGMQLPITVPSSMLSAANSVVVPLRL